MKLTKTQRHLLERGLLSSTTNEEKWKVVLMIIIPNIIGQELFRDGMNHNNNPPTPSTSREKIENVVICADMLVLTLEKIYHPIHGFMRGPYPHSFQIQYKQNRPIIDGDKLSLDVIMGWGQEPWYIPLEIATG